MSSVFDAKAQLLRVYVPEGRMKDGQGAAEWIVCRACEHGLAGASVLRGIGGYYMNDPVVAPEFFNLRMSHPVIVEMVDQPEKIEEFSGFLKKEMSGLLLCRNEVDICVS
ncbi:MAG: hypothetical protein BWY31_01684 [Lentisphaerae bacterium ADurb.Bin242]|nr:MAG: hypothetical protein BWY31_01684 [Lentisphaerae bacterium ADurb.Bin242]